MIENDLLASVALFRKLYDKENYKNIFDILADFIRGGVIYENKLTYTSEEIKGLLKKVYGFDIPESVIRTTLRTRFEGRVTKNSNTYTFQDTVKHNFEKIEEELEHVNSKNQQLINNLYAFISQKLKKELSKEEKTKIFENFTHFTMDNGYSDQYSELIGAFVVKNEHDDIFASDLNSIREGIILYQGLSYTADLNELGKWNTDLDIFLAPEHLFNANGYNGILFNEIFNDFYTLVNDINKANKPSVKGRDKKIKLYYLPETKAEIDSFFYIGEMIIDGKKTIDPSKIAMQTLVKNANTKSDIKTKQVSFYNDLQGMGIIEKNVAFDPIKHSRYNVLDQTVIDEIELEAKKNSKNFDEDFCHNQLLLFSKINLQRQGKNSVPFEQISHIYVTENAVSKYLAHNNLVKFKKEDTPFAKDIDFIIARFWFKLKKGFNSNSHLPKSFDLVNKAKIIISSYTNNTISREYLKVNKQFKDGILTKEDVVKLNIELKEKNNVPEYFNESNIDATLEFLNDKDFIESIKRESERKSTKLEEVETELALYRQKEAEQKQQDLRKEIQKNIIISASIEWNSFLRNKTKSVTLFLGVFILNLPVVIFPCLIMFNPSVKNWIMKFNGIQITCFLIYILIILIDVLGSRYLYNKVKIVEGFNWLPKLIFLKRERRKFMANTIKRLESERL